MQMEYEGYIQQQPTYSHVGYTAACIDTYVSTTRNPMSGMFIGAALLLMILATVTFRRSHGWLRFVVAPALVIATIASAYGALLSLNSPAYHLSDAFYATLYRMERLVIATDAWCAEHGRAPTQTEWEKMFAEDDRKDGWGNQFAYDDSASYGRRPYQITSLGELRGRHPDIVWDIPCYWLGSDGRFGTQDDGHMLEYIGRRTDWSQYLHPPRLAPSRYL